jgi:hypothetical protein
VLHLVKVHRTLSYSIIIIMIYDKLCLVFQIYHAARLFPDPSTSNTEKTYADVKHSNYKSTFHDLFIKFYLLTTQHYVYASFRIMTK